MPSQRTRLGTQGEAIATAHLESQGLAIAERNYRTRPGEIDIVGREGDTVVFVEVKTRRASAYGTPEESITRRKRERLAKTAMLYLEERGLTQHAWRVDLVAITLSPRGPARINHVRSIVEDLG